MSDHRLGGAHHELGSAEPSLHRTTAIDSVLGVRLDRRAIGQGAGIDHRVGAAHILARRCATPRFTPRREGEVLIRLIDDRRREAFADRLGGAVGRAVVDNDDRGANRRRSAL